MRLKYSNLASINSVSEVLGTYQQDCGAIIVNVKVNRHDSHSARRLSESESARNEPALFCEKILSKAADWTIELVITAVHIVEDTVPLTSYFISALTSLKVIARFTKRQDR